MCSQPAAVEPGLTYDPVAVGSEFGWFLLVERGRSDDLSFGLRIRDVSRDGTALGAELPVVREREFRTRPLNLLDLPVDFRFRVTVRVYSLKPAEGAQVRVRVYEQRRPLYINMSHEPDQLLGERVYMLSRHPLADRSAEQYPSFAFITDLPIEHPPAASNASVRVQVIPLAGDVAIWAFATLTNNESQAVTVVTPR